VDPSAAREVLKFSPEESDISAIVKTAWAWHLIYYAFIASDQYLAEAKFTVSGGEPAKLDGVGAFLGIPAINSAAITLFIFFIMLESRLPSLSNCSAQYATLTPAFR
jgi:capsule polysaccharide export protein KpsE/RkpR